MAAIVLWLLFLSITALSSSVFADELALVVGQSTPLLVVPKVRVSNSPGSKPGANVVAERVHIYGLSRMKNLNILIPVFTNQISRNSSLGIGMCPQGQWQKLSKGLWARKISPFDHKLLDIRMVSSSPETLKVTVDEGHFQLSCMSACTFGVWNVFLSLSLSYQRPVLYVRCVSICERIFCRYNFWEGTKLLPTGRRNSLAIFIYSSLLAIFFLLFLFLAGAWLGFWVVRKLILTEDGSIDTMVSQFVAWSIRILGAVMVLQCSLDPLLAAEALVLAIFVSLSLRRATRPRLLLRLSRKLWKATGRSPQKLKKPDLSPADGKHVEYINSFQYSEDVLLSPQSRWATNPIVLQPKV